MASLFRIALSLFDSAPGKIVIVDEPELSLHPQAQKGLALVLSRYSADRQIIVTTHSPYFVNWSDLAAGAKIYRLTQERNGIVVGSLDNSTISTLGHLIDDWQKPNLLDAVAREVFFADEVVFLEGQEDVGLLRKFTEDRALPMLSAFGYGVGGFGNLKHFLQMAEDLDIPAAAIFDGDHAKEMAAAKAEFQDALVELLPTPDVRDKPGRDEAGRETDKIQKEGLFDRNGLIKPQYEEYLVGLLAKIEKHFSFVEGNLQKDT